MKNKWLRMLVCFVLVCGILVNISPIRARSVVVDTAVAVSGVALLTWAYLAAAGVVYIPQSVAQLNAFEKSLDDWWSQNLKSDEDWEEYRNYVDNFNDMYLGFMEPDAPRPPDNKLLAKVVGTAMGTALAGFAYGVIKDQEEIEVEEEVPDYSVVDGETISYKWGTTPYYVSSDSPFSVMGFISSNTLGTEYSVWVFSSSKSVSYQSGGSTKNPSMSLHPNYPVYYYRINSFIGSSEWNIEGIPVYEFGSSDEISTYGCQLFANDGKITVPVLPDTYVGDIPDQVKNGTLTAESLPLPDTFDLTSIVSSPETALQDVQSLAQQLSDGGVTYNDYITNITYVEDPEPETTEPTQAVPGTGTDPTTPSDSEGEDSGDDTEDEDEKLEELEFYTLDLTEFFPFCIPFDIYEFFSILSATPQAPVFDWPIVVPALGLDYTISVDLSPWNDVAALFRKLELMAFIVGLGFVTRKNFLRG